MSTTQDTSDPIGVRSLHQNLKRSHEIGKDAGSLVLNIPVFVFRLSTVPLTICIVATAAWTTPLMRRRAGLYHIMAYGMIGLVSFLAVADYFAGSIVSFIVLSLWMLTLIGLFIAQLAVVVMRLLRPTPSNYVHRWDVGHARPRLQRFWDLTLRGWSVYPVRVALIGEPALLLALACVVWFFEPASAMDKVPGKSSAAWLLVMSAAGIFLHAAYGQIQKLMTLQKLRDQEFEQLQLADSLSESPIQPIGRESEGIAQIPSGRRS